MRRLSTRRALRHTARMPLDPITTIATPRLELVPLAPEHLDDLMAVNGDDRVTRFLPYATWASRLDAEAWFIRMQGLQDAGGTRQLVLKRLSDARAIGTLLLFRHEEASRRAELGYAMAADCWGQGYMREAVRGACAHAFGPLGLRRLEAEVNPANAASCRLLAQVGFVHEGTLRQRWTAKDHTYDTHLMGLLLQDWQGLVEKAPARSS